MPDTTAPGARPAPRPRKRSLIELVTELPELVSDLVHAEIDLIKTELVGKLKALGIGAGLIAGALVVLLFMIGTLLTAAILGLGTVIPPWLAALLVSALLLIVAVVLGLLGWSRMKKAIPPIPSEGIESLQKDVRAIKGLGKRGQYR